MSSHLHSPVSPLVARDLSKSYGDRVVLDGVDLVANPGQPLGIVGENGVGKSTLLRVVAGVEPIDGGSVAKPADLAYLDQEPSFPHGATIAAVLATALRPLHDGVARLEELATHLDDPAAADEYAALLEWARLHDAWDADRRAETAAAVLGLGTLEPDRLVAAMSGGEQMRLALAALVVRRPACVLLDEPTNHLDDGAMAVLEEFLGSLPGVVVVASHDRTFLENVCRAVVDLDPSHFGVDGTGGNRFTGGYSAYLSAKRAARRRWETAFLDQQEELNRLRVASRTSARQVAHNRGPRDNDRFIYHSKGENVARTISRRVKEAEKRIEAVERERIPKPPRQISFRSTLGSSGSDRSVVSVRDLEVEGRLRVARLDLAAGQRLLVTGPNGCGKSTLLKVMAGRLRPTAGTVHVSTRRLAYLPQDVTFSRPDRTPHELFEAALATVPAGQRRVPLGDLGLLHPRELSRPVEVLSVGQQRRLALAILVARRPGLLLLDEPTNHISLALADELEEALQRSTGTVVIASHDRWLRRGWQGETLLIEPSRADD